MIDLTGLTLTARPFSNFGLPGNSQISPQIDSKSINTNISNIINHNESSNKCNNSDISVINVKSENVANGTNSTSISNNTSSQLAITPNSNIQLTSPSTVSSSQSNNQSLNMAQLTAFGNLYIQSRTLKKYILVRILFFMFFRSFTSHIKPFSFVLPHESKYFK